MSMGTRVDAEDIEVTRGEKLLAVVLSIFLLVGALWAYARIDVGTEPEFREPTALLDPAQRAVLDRETQAAELAASARDSAVERRNELVQAREEYRAGLDAGRRDAALEADYRAAQDRDRVAADLSDRRAAALTEARAAAKPVRADSDRRERAEFRRLEDQADRDALATAGLRLLLTVALLAGALWLMALLRRRRSRRLVVGYAAVAAAGVLGFVMGIDYLTDYIDPLDLGPLVLSALGTGLTLVALVVLQRQLAHRLPGRRVRRGECPYCGYPSGRGDHCEGCGREVVGACATCTAPRRVGTLHCAACGAA